jgi:hypothetical protein
VRVLPVDESEHVVAGEVDAVLLRPLSRCLVYSSTTCPGGWRRASRSRRARRRLMTPPATDGPKQQPPALIRRSVSVRPRQRRAVSRTYRDAARASSSRGESISAGMRAADGGRRPAAGQRPSRRWRHARPGCGRGVARTRGGRRDSATPTWSAAWRWVAPAMQAAKMRSGPRGWSVSAMCGPSPWCPLHWPPASRHDVIRHAPVAHPRHPRLPAGMEHEPPHPGLVAQHPGPPSVKGDRPSHASRLLALLLAWLTGNEPAGMAVAGDPGAGCDGLVTSLDLHAITLNGGEPIANRRLSLMIGVEAREGAYGVHDVTEDWSPIASGDPISGRAADFAREGGASPGDGQQRHAQCRNHGGLDVHRFPLS